MTVTLEPIDFRHKVERLALSGVAFDEIEAVIDRAFLRDDQKAALWLLAWSYQAPEVQRRVAREALAAVAT
jgi:hypothetical protein